MSVQALAQPSREPAAAAPGHPHPVRRRRRTWGGCGCPWACPAPPYPARVRPAARSSWWRWTARRRWRRTRWRRCWRRARCWCARDSTTRRASSAPSLLASDPADRRVREFARMVQREHVAALYRELPPSGVPEPVQDPEAHGAAQPEERHMAGLVNGGWDVSTLVLASQPRAGHAQVPGQAVPDGAHPQVHPRVARAGVGRWRRRTRRGCWTRSG